MKMNKEITDEMIDRALARTYPVPDGLSQRVKAACRHAEMKRRRSLRKIGWKIAAVLIVTATISALMVYRYTAMEREALANASNGVWHGATNEADAASRRDGINYVYNQVVMNTRNDLDNTRLVSTANSAAAADRTEMVHSVNGQVCHVWGAPQSADCLQNAATKFDCRIAENGTTKDGCPKFLIRGTDRNIQAIVDELHDAGWILYSADFPQPKCAPITVFGNAETEYSVTVVER